MLTQTYLCGRISEIQDFQDLLTIRRTALFFLVPLMGAWAAQVHVPTGNQGHVRLSVEADDAGGIVCKKPGQFCPQERFHAVVRDRQRGDALIVGLVHHDVLVTQK